MVLLNSYNIKLQKLFSYVKKLANQAVLLLGNPTTKKLLTRNHS